MEILNAVGGVLEIGDLHEAFLDRSSRGESVEDGHRTGLVVGPGGSGSTEGLLSDLEWKRKWEDQLGG
jgi:hypothetical protein